jgi:putative ATPase
MQQPLAAQLRPTTIHAVIGQRHLTAPGKPLYEAIHRAHRFSFILWGPPGTGKTTLARLYASALGAHFQELSAVSAGKDDVKQFIASDAGGRPRVLFLDEIHRFNKSQQDFLLPHVESGEVTLIGATTENPSFEVISALLSRCRVFSLYALSGEDIEAIVRRASISIDDEALQWLTRMAGGDARQALAALEETYALHGHVSKSALEETVQSPINYDKQGEEHYNTISAFIKSMRASQPDAAVYYLARMIEGGEDPLFIARRMVIFASEDVGLAQPTALVVANEVFRAVQTVGLPEAAINLSHGAAYLAQAHKDRSAYNALRSAQRDVQRHGALSIPYRLRNAVTDLMEQEGYGREYEPYTTDDLLPDELKGCRYFR